MSEGFTAWTDAVTRCDHCGRAILDSNDHTEDDGLGNDIHWHADCYRVMQYEAYREWQEQLDAAGQER